MKLHGKIDSNQKEIVKALREIPGVSVLSMASLGNGAPDLLVGYNFKNYLFEIKKDRKAKLTEMEGKFYLDWHGQLSIVCSLDEILKVIGII